MTAGCVGGPVTCHFLPRTVQLQLPEEREPLPTPLHGDCAYPVDCASAERVHLAFAVAGSGGYRTAYPGAFVYHYLHKAVVQGDAIAIRQVFPDQPSPVWWTMAVAVAAGRTPVSWARVQGCVGLLLDEECTLVFRDQASAATARLTLECAGFRTGMWLPVGPLLDVGDGRWAPLRSADGSADGRRSTVPPHVTGRTQEEPAIPYLLRWTSPGYNVTSLCRHLALKHTAPCASRHDAKLICRRHKPWHAAAYLATFQHPILDRDMWEPIKCPRALSRCIKGQDEADREYENDSGPTELELCFVISVRLLKAGLRGRPCPDAWGFKLWTPRSGLQVSQTRLCLQTRKTQGLREQFYATLVLGA